MEGALAPPRGAPPSDDVGDLVRRAGAGDRQAEAVLCRRFAPAARAFAARRLVGRDAIEEFVQDVMLLLIEVLRGDAIADPSRIGGFVLGICRNLARDRARTQERRKELWQRYGSALTEAFEPVEPRACGYEVAQLEDCLSQLSARSRELIKLTFVDDESNEHIASRLDLSAVNVRVARHRTLKVLRDCMSQKISWELS